MGPLELFIVVLWFACAAGSAAIAANKGHNGVLWFFVGLCFGLAAVVVVALIPDARPPTLPWTSPATKLPPPSASVPPPPPPPPPAA